MRRDAGECVFCVAAFVAVAAIGAASANGQNLTLARAQAEIVVAESMAEQQTEPLVDVAAISGQDSETTSLLLGLARSTEPPGASGNNLLAAVDDLDAQIDHDVLAQSFSSRLPTGGGLHDDDACLTSVEDMAPPALKRLLFHSDADKMAETGGLRPCHCGKDRQDGGPCIFRAWAEPRTRAWVADVAKNAERIKKACGAKGGNSVLPTKRFAGSGAGKSTDQEPSPPDENEREDDRAPSLRMCAVCGVETASDVFEPCGHVVLCGACMQPDDCPACASQKDPAQDFEFAPGFVPVQDEDWLLLSLNRAKKTREKFVEACCLQIWSANFLGSGKGFMCIQSTAFWACALFKFLTFWACALFKFLTPFLPLSAPQALILTELSRSKICVNMDLSCTKQSHEC